VRRDRAPHPTSSARRRGARINSSLAIWRSVAFGGDATKPATVSGLLQGEAASGSVVTLGRLPRLFVVTILHAR